MAADVTPNSAGVGIADTERWTDGPPLVSLRFTGVA